MTDNAKKQSITVQRELEAEHKREINGLEQKFKSREAFFKEEISSLKNAHREEKKRIAEVLDRETSKLIEEGKIRLENELSKVKAQNKALQKQVEEMVDRAATIERKEMETMKILPGMEVKMRDLETSKKCQDDEVQYLRQSRLELAKEREVLLVELRGFQQEIESLYKSNKLLNTKVGKLEGLLYGRKIGK